jgi:CheY-like chemotaxis protein
MNPKKVLVIDDEVPFTRLLRLGLEGTHRFLVEVVNNPCDALSRAERFMPDIILLDVMMPQLDGGDLAARFRDHPMLRSVPIVFLTAAVRKEEVPSGNGLIGGLRFLAKPVELRELMRCLAECLEEPDEAPHGAFP